MSAVVADTQTILWYLLKSPRLSAKAAQTLNDAMASVDGVYVSTISLVEVAYLAEKRRVVEEVYRRLLRAMLDDGV